MARSVAKVQQITNSVGPDWLYSSPERLPLLKAADPLVYIQPFIASGTIALYIYKKSACTFCLRTTDNFLILDLV